MKTSQNGFVLAGVMILAGVVGAGVVASLAFKKIIDKETQMANTRHSAYIIEDSIRSEMARLAFAVGSYNNPSATRRKVIDRLRLATKSCVDNVTISGRTCTPIRMPIPNSNCNISGDANNKRPCDVYISGVKFYTDKDSTKPYYCNLQNQSYDQCENNSLTDLTQIMNNATIAILSIRAESIEKDNNGIAHVEDKRRVGVREISVPIPDVTEIKESKIVQANELKCPLSAPVFKGTEVVYLNREKRLQAKCEAIPSSTLYSVSTSTAGSATNTTDSGGKMTISCNTAEGGWLLGLNQNLSPKCDRYPAGTGISNPVVKLCADGQVSTGFKLGKKFNISDIKCRVKGGPYDFER